MNAIELFEAGGKATGIFYCAKCRHVARDQQTADKCCTPNVCACGTECQPYHTKCGQCCEKERTVNDAATLAAAQKIDTWDGPVMCESVGYNDGYFESVEDLMDHLSELAEEDEDYKQPEFAFTCRSIPFAADLEDLTARSAEQMYDGFHFDDLDGLEALKVAIAIFNEANTRHVRWEVDWKVAVRLPNVEVEAA